MGNKELRKERVYSGETEGDNRSQFQRDRDRILYTPALRRLAGVTQVVHATTERGYHNRLTHSLKVAQVGRRLAENLVNNTRESVIDDAGGLSPDVVESASLAHDIGHPPFGHAAEQAIQDQLEKVHNIYSSFEGNPQSFRIVNNVSIHKSEYGPDHQGLDLTLATLNAMLKYPWQRDTTGKRSKKWGYYVTEKSEFDKVRELRTPGSSDDTKSLEATIMDWADDVTYAIHDVVDFYQAGLIPLDELIRDTNEREKFISSFEDSDAANDVPNTWDASEFFHTSIRKLGDVAGNTKGNTLESSFNGTSFDQATLGFLVSELVERYLGIDSDADVEVTPAIAGGLEINAELKYEVKLLKYLTEYYVFKDPALVAQQHGHKRVVKDLFSILYEATDKNSEYRKMVPSPFDEKIKMIHGGPHGYNDIDSDTLRARNVADMIASMSEQQVFDLYKRVTGQSPGLVTDRIVSN